MKSLFPPSSLLYAVGGLSGMCVMGAGAGFLVDRWWGLDAGLVLGVGVFLLLTRGDPQGEAAAYMALHAVVLYEAAVFPLRPSAVIMNGTSSAWSRTGSRPARGCRSR